jgi:hypothetical protein
MLNHGHGQDHITKNKGGYEEGVDEDHEQDMEEAEEGAREEQEHGIRRAEKGLKEEEGICERMRNKG